MEIPADAQLPSSIEGYCCAAEAISDELLIYNGTAQLRIVSAALRHEQLSDVLGNLIAIVPRGSCLLKYRLFRFKVVVESARATPPHDAGEFFYLSAGMLEELSTQGLLDLDKQLRADYLAPIKVQLFRQSFEKYIEYHKHQLDAAVHRRYRAKCEEQCEYYRQLFTLQMQEETDELKAQMGRMRCFLQFLEAYK